MITAETFKFFTGLDPVQDDLERANCTSAGLPGHSYCGWDHDAMAPVQFTSPINDPKPRLVWNKDAQMWVNWERSPKCGRTTLFQLTAWINQKNAPNYRERYIQAHNPEGISHDVERAAAQLHRA